VKGDDSPGGLASLEGLAPGARPSTVKTTCPYCGTGCGLTLYEARGELLGSGPIMDAPASEGALCVKGQYGTDFIRSDERTQTPLIREGENFREASWD